MPQLLPVLSIDALNFFRPERPILTNINWHVNAGEVAAVLGPNGCGKSTLLRMISGYLWPSSGNISVLGQHFGECDLRTLRERIGVVEATTVYPFDENMNALDVVCSGFHSSLTIAYVEPTAHQWNRSEESLAQVGLSDRVDQPYYTMSTGQRMRTLIARALVRKPELLLLDEPTAGLDLPARETVLATVNSLSQVAAAPAVVIVTHHLEELLPSTSNVLLLSLAGHTTAQGSPEKVLTDENLSTAYNWPICVHKNKGRYYATVDPQSWSKLHGPA